MANHNDISWLVEVSEFYLCCAVISVKPLDQICFIVCLLLNQYASLVLRKMVFLLHVCFLYAVIDITRMVVLHPDGAIALQKHFESEKGISISIMRHSFYFETYLSSCALFDIIGNVV